MGAGFTAGIVQQLGVTPTAALVARFGGQLTGGEACQVVYVLEISQVWWWCRHITARCSVTSIDMHTQLRRSANPIYKLTTG
jgi:hypothetical protein